MLKRMLSVLLMVCLSAALFAGGDSEAGDTSGEKKAVSFEVVATQPEYLEQDLILLL